MYTCPYRDTFCGEKTALGLVENDQLTICDIDGEEEVFLDSPSVLEMLDILTTHDQLAVFGCLACGNVVQVYETDGAYTVRTIAFE
jgi:hypothetical protein